ncbi:EF-hand domain-containing protein [Sphingomonas sp.]|uniref:EF-hand domain-containing protein n=1 Tax=Sphingomonas sp. TaxID=28214 RepID=UPI0025D3BD8E|nr:EF-hand domain-containing protein [Sphingomonas sp.]
MWRFLGGVASALLLITAGLFIWKAQANRESLIPAMPIAAAAGAPMSMVDLAGPPSASEKTREEKRFSRYDKNKNGAVDRDEYLVSRQKAFAKLDLNHDGKLDFDEYATKAVIKFAGADRDKNGALTNVEFASTRVVRKPKPKPKCAPTVRAPAIADEPEEG